MNDRFKFRVWITAPITRDVEEEKEVSFYIYDIALYDDGGIGFSRDSLLDALDKLNLTERQRNEIEDYISDNSYSEDWEWYAISFDGIEQCTSLKDKNSKLIYEGDIVRSESYPFKREEGTYNYAAEICFDKDSAAFFYWIFRTSSRVAGRSEGNTGQLDEYEWEVIGNIHENADLLEVVYDKI